MKRKTEGTEAWAQDRVREMLRAKGIPSQKIPGSALLAGMPDLFCGAFWIEMKRPGGKLRWSQVAWATKWDLHARIYVVDRPEMLWRTVGTSEHPGANNWRQFAPRERKLEGALEAWTRKTEK
jgi:hypothetical protein